MYLARYLGESTRLLGERPETVHTLAWKGSEPDARASGDQGCIRFPFEIMEGREGVNGGWVCETRAKFHLC